MHLLVIFFVALLVFGPKKLPELGRGIGDGIRELKKGLNDATASKAEQKTSEVKKAKQFLASIGLQRDWCHLIGDCVWCDLLPRANWTPAQPSFLIPHAALLSGLQVAAPRTQHTNRLPVP